MSRTPIIFPPTSSSFSSSSLISLANVQRHFLKEDGKSILPGFECLMPLDTIFLEQIREEGEHLPGLELDNQYILKNIHGQRILLASENTEFCYRCLLGSSRPFEVNVYDHSGNQVINVRRPCTFGLCCVCGICCGNYIEVTHESGHIVGVVRQTCSLVPTFEVFDSNEKIAFIIRGPSKRCLCGKVNFKIFTIDEAHVEVEIGHITKEWGGIIKESFTDDDTFAIIFPQSLRTEFKAVLIGSSFLIDYTYFETHG